MKDYQKWHLVKIKIESEGKPELFREREIWWCSIGENIWYEQDGKNESFERPVLVLKKFSHDVFLGIPMTSTQKEHPYYFPYRINDVRGSFILSQARVLSVKRLQRKMAVMKGFSFQRIKEAYLKLLQ